MINSSAEREPFIDEYGNKSWKNEAGQYHRTDGPAIIRSNGTKEWCIDGKRHRADGPAYEGSNGTKYWYIDGKLHRADGPAIEYANEMKKWYIDGKQYSEAEYNALRCVACSRTDCPTKEK